MVKRFSDACLVQELGAAWTQHENLKQPLAGAAYFGGRLQVASVALDRGAPRCRRVDCSGNGWSAFIGYVDRLAARCEGCAARGLWVEVRRRNIEPVD